VLRIFVLFSVILVFESGDCFIAAITLCLYAHCKRLCGAYATNKGLSVCIILYSEPQKNVTFYFSP